MYLGSGISLGFVTFLIAVGILFFMIVGYLVSKDRREATLPSILGVVFIMLAMYGLASLVNDNVIYPKGEILSKNGDVYRVVTSSDEIKYYQIQAVEVTGRK
jgi:hypothetical protein